MKKIIVSILFVCVILLNNVVILAETMSFSENLPLYPTEVYIRTGTGTNNSYLDECILLNGNENSITVCFDDDYRKNIYKVLLYDGTEMKRVSPEYSAVQGEVIFKGLKTNNEYRITISQIVNYGIVSGKIVTGCID